jgi:hypothetical protein
VGLWAHSALPNTVQYCVQSVGEYTTASSASSMDAFVSAGVLAAALQHGPQDLLKVVQGITITSTPPQVRAEMLGKRCTNLSQLKEDVTSTHPAYILRNSVIQQYCLYRQAQHTAQHTHPLNVSYTRVVMVCRSKATRDQRHPSTIQNQADITSTAPRSCNPPFGDQISPLCCASADMMQGRRM